MEITSLAGNDYPTYTVCLELIKALYLGDHINYEITIKPIQVLAAARVNDIERLGFYINVYTSNNEFV